MESHRHGTVGLVRERDHVAEAAAAPDVKTAEAHFEGYGEQPISQQALGLHHQLRELDLLSHVADLEVLGLTVIPPEKVGVDVVAAREAVLDVAEQRRGARPDWRGAQRGDVTDTVRRDHVLHRP